MNFFRKTRPQDLFEGVWSESSFVTRLIWEMTLAFHSSESEETKTNFLNFLETKSKEMFQIEEKLYEIRKEIAEIFYKNCQEPYQEEWYHFVKEISSFQETLIPAMMRLFLLKDILLQMDNKHPKKKEIEQVFQQSFENLLKAKEIIDKVTNETEKSSQAVLDAIVIARSIEEGISFEEAEKREKKKMEMN